MTNKCEQHSNPLDPLSREIVCLRWNRFLNFQEEMQPSNVYWNVSAEWYAFLFSRFLFGNCNYLIILYPFISSAINKSSDCIYLCIQKP